MALGPVPCAPYGRTGTAELPAAVLPFLPGHDALLLANHGAVTLGPDLERAYWRMEILEHTAQIHLNVRLLGYGAPLAPEQAAALRGGASPPEGRKIPLLRPRDVSGILGPSYGSARGTKSNAPGPPGRSVPRIY